jgi:multiple sugar transport system substrate-binding protein
MPVWQAGTPASANWGGSSTALTTGTKYPEDALAFALWLSTNRKSIAILGKGYGRPAVTSSVAGNAFTKPTAFFGGQDYDKIFAQASAVVDKKWIWIPTITTTYQHLRDAFGDVVAGKSTLVDAIGVIHRNTVADLKAKGLTVKEK